MELLNIKNYVNVKERKEINKKYYESHKEIKN